MEYLSPTKGRLTIDEVFSETAPTLTGILRTVFA